MSLQGRACSNDWHGTGPELLGHIGPQGKSCPSHERDLEAPHGWPSTHLQRRQDLIHSPWTAWWAENSFQESETTFL